MNKSRIYPNKTRRARLTNHHVITGPLAPIHPSIHLSVRPVMGGMAVRNHAPAPSGNNDGGLYISGVKTLFIFMIQRPFNQTAGTASHMMTLKTAR